MAQPIIVTGGCGAMTVTWALVERTPRLPGESPFVAIPVEGAPDEVCEICDGAVSAGSRTYYNGVCAALCPACVRDIQVA